MEYFRIFLGSPIYEELSFYTIDVQHALTPDPITEYYLDTGPMLKQNLPEGIYFFTQIKKEIQSESAIIDLSIELQKEALWRRLKPGKELYVRRLYEDGSPVTQLWRPLIPGTSL